MKSVYITVREKVTLIVDLWGSNLSPINSYVGLYDRDGNIDSYGRFTGLKLITD